jgi:beta-glucosidase
VDAGVASAMASFNKVNGAYATENRTLLIDILRERFGFRGWVMSDYGATHSTAPAANAGLDQEQPAAGNWGDHLREAVEAGEVAESVIDDKVRNILRPLIGLGQLERRPTIEEFDVAGHDATAREIAAAGMVLLRNRGVLPLDPATVGSVIVIGSDVDSAGAQGGGSSLVRPTSTSSPVQGIAARLGSEVAWIHGADPVTPGALLPGPAPIPSSLLSDGDGSPGLRAQYWTNAGFDGDPFLERTDPQVDVNLGFFNFPGFNAASPRMPQLPAELNGQTSARWTGVLTVPETGVYGLSVTALGWFSLTLDESVVIHSGGEADAAVINAPDPTYPYGQLTLQGATAEPEVHTIECELEAGRDYHLRLEYSANSAEQGFLTGAQVRLGWVPPEGVVDPAVRAAAARAAEAHVAIVVVRDYESEQADRPHLVLPGAQEALVRAVAAANPRTVVVVMTGAPTDMSGWDDAAAIVQAWYPGQAQGAALADVLFGDVDPGGRLPLTLPAVAPITDAASYPGVGGRVVYPEGVFVGYRGLGSTDADPPLFPFGHGLSYTTFDYSDLEVRPGAGDVAGVASVTVTNTGDRVGSDVVQAYVGELSAPVPTPLRQLAAFAKVRLRPGESTRVELPIPVRAVSYWDVETHEWAQATGDVDVSIGASSRDIRASAPFTVDVARSTPDRQPVR